MQKYAFCLEKTSFSFSFAKEILSLSREKEITVINNITLKTIVL